MAMVSESELQMMLGDDLGSDVYHVQCVTDWLSIRILDVLARLGEGSIGDISEEVRMDFRETADRLSQLENEGIVEVRGEDGQRQWSLAWDALHIHLGASEDGLQIVTTAEHRGDSGE